MSHERMPRPALTADTVAVAGPSGARNLLLVLRAKAPFEGCWALPGGFVDEYEAPEAAARRELAEETSLVVEGKMLLAGVFGEKNRDPRGWTVSVAYAVDVGGRLPEVRGSDDAAQAAWHPIDGLPDLAFDHTRIVEAGLKVLSDV